MTYTYALVENARHGRFLVNRHDTYVGRSMITYGEWGEAEVRLFKKLLRPGDVVVEAGANIGSHTIPLSRIVGHSGKVFAFEPQQLIFQMLCANAALNDCWNIDTRHAAVGATNTTVAMERLAPNVEGNFGSIMVNARYADSLGVDRVPLVTIDSLALERLDLLKADVEGFEQAVIEGARKTIARLRPVIYLEHNDLNNWTVPDLLWNLGYDCYWYFTTLWDPNNFYGSPEDIWSPAGSRIFSYDIVALPHDGKWRIGGLLPLSKDNPVSSAALPMSMDNYVEMPIVERS